jgi:hypothetical protein
MLKKIFWSAAMVALVFVLGADSAQAQNEWERQVGDYLSASADALADEGYREMDVFTGSLDDSEDESVWIDLRGSSDYAIVGVCDNDCDDIDLYIYDEDGDEIDSDASTDDVPVLELSTRGSGEFRVRVRMFNCDTEPCYYAFGVYRRAGGNNRANNNNSSSGGPTSQVRRSLRNAYNDMLADRGFDPTDDQFDSSLDSSEEESHWVTLYRGDSYTFLGACDDDCGDLDLFLYDEDGDEVDSDVSTDAIPTVSVSPRRTGDYRIMARMYSCTVEPCYYSVGVYSR